MFARCAEVSKSQENVKCGSCSRGQHLVKMVERTPSGAYIRQKWYKERPQFKEHYLMWNVDDREKQGFYRLEG